MELYLTTTLQTIMDKIILYLESNLIGNTQKVEFGINDVLIGTAELPVSQFEIDINLSAGLHTLWLKLCNKDSTNEIYDQKQDTYVRIKNVSINASMMNNLLNDHGYVQPDWKHHADVAEWFVANHGNVPEKLEKSTYLNLKGYYYFNFELPIKDFLDSNIFIDTRYEKMYNAPLDRYLKLKNKILESDENPE